MKRTASNIVEAANVAGLLCALLVDDMHLHPTASTPAQNTIGERATSDENEVDSATHREPFRSSWSARVFCAMPA
jgi:hypothetical protein